MTTTTTNLREDTIRKIEARIWVVEHMDSKSASKMIVTNNHGRAQGAIELAFELEIITQEEYDNFWARANQAAYDNAAYWC